MLALNHAAVLLGAAVLALCPLGCGRIDESVVRSAIERRVLDAVPEGVEASFRYTGVGEGDSNAFHYGFELAMSCDRPTTFTLAEMPITVGPASAVQLRLEAVFHRRVTEHGTDWRLTSLHPRP